VAGGNDWFEGNLRLNLFGFWIMDLGGDVAMWGFAGGGGGDGVGPSRLANCKKLKVDFMPDQPRSMHPQSLYRPSPGADATKAISAAAWQRHRSAVVTPSPFGSPLLHFPTRDPDAWSLLGNDERQQQLQYVTHPQISTEKNSTWWVFEIRGYTSQYPKMIHLMS